MYTAVVEFTARCTLHCHAACGHADSAEKVKGMAGGRTRWCRAVRRRQIGVGSVLPSPPRPALPLHTFCPARSPAARACTRVSHVACSGAAVRGRYARGPGEHGCRRGYLHRRSLPSPTCKQDAGLGVRRRVAERAVLRVRCPSCGTQRRSGCTLKLLIQAQAKLSQAQQQKTDAKLSRRTKHPDACGSRVSKPPR